MNNHIYSTLAEYITTEILKQPTRSLTPDQPLISGGLIDSFSLVDLALFIENIFGVRIDDTELNVETFDTLFELSELIQSRKS